MLSNITSNSQKGSGDRQSLLAQGDQVYLYGDTNYTGMLIRPVERTYPQKWSVALDRGGYEAVNVKQISLVESQLPNLANSDLDLPFSDAPESGWAQLQQEIAVLKQENARLQQENELVKKDLDCAKEVIRRAKDISPLMRISLKRVLRLAHDACMDVQRTVGGWILRMGKLARKFRRLADIWDLLSVDEFVLSEIFAEDKLIAVELIRPPKRRKKPESRDKQTFPLMRPEDVMRNRTMFKVLSG
ncbi:MAG: hypothetical protein AAF298_08560 [Cyanobacteria bacterium P01_A01_bin.40]